MADRLDKLVADTSSAMANQVEEWLHGLGIETEEDARLVAERWMIEYGPVELSGEDAVSVRLSQTVRLVPRSSNDTP